MANPQPWQERWEPVDDERERGGQGETFRVRDKTSGEIALLKLLKNQRNDQARRRMYQEVANLRALHAAECKVPAVIDDNTAEFKTASVRLFFVMEFIEGKTLADEIRARQRLDLDTAIKLVQNLAATMKLAIENDVIHRDLKPENIMVRRLDPPDIVVLDYGLSFNLAEPKDVTRASESLDNDFLSLPERRVPGGNRRDPRSDTTGLCGILFFCLSGERPVDLRDEQGNPPHRRVGSRSADFTDDPTKARALDSLFGRGFALALGGRFQDVDSFLERLDGVVNPGMQGARRYRRQYGRI